MGQSDVFVRPKVVSEARSGKMVCVYCGEPSSHLGMIRKGFTFFPICPGCRSRYDESKYLFNRNV